MSGNDALSKRMAALRRQNEHARNQANLREKRRLDKEREALRRIPLLERLSHKSWFRKCKWAVSIFGLILTIVSGIYGMFGPIWPTDPEIHPHDVLNGSSFILPFTVKNRSILFHIKDAEFTCGVDWLYYKATGVIGTLAPMAFISGSFTINARDTINYECNASQLIKTDTDGSLKLRGMEFPRQMRAYPPLIVQKMCIWIKVDYKIFGVIPRHFTSAIFQWPATPNVAQWLEGAVHQEHQITMEEWLPQRGNLSPAVVACGDSPHTPGLVFDKAGNAIDPLGPLRSKMPW